ncbi:MAG: acyl-CoA thioesterase [Saprospiraceae bacterium]|nr:acyl-CoA thioesterase [Saprospiraceae bacterium]
MKPYLRTFRLRWNDLDANRHAANSAYANMANDTRIGFMSDHGANQQWMAEVHLAPVLLREEWHYLRELHYDEQVSVNVELAGRTPDYRFVRFAHSLLRADGTLAAYSEVLWVWIDLQTRKMADPPERIVQAVDDLPRTAHYALLSREDTRLPPHVPVAGSA